MEKEREMVLPPLVFDTPPKNQGQIVEVSYAYDIELDKVYKKIHDHSDNRVILEVADIPVGHDFDKNPIEPWNCEPTGLIFRPL